MDKVYPQSAKDFGNTSLNSPRYRSINNIETENVTKEKVAKEKRNTSYKFSYHIASTSVLDSGAHSHNQ